MGDEMTPRGVGGCSIYLSSVNGPNLVPRRGPDDVTPTGSMGRRVAGATGVMSRRVLVGMRRLSREAWFHDKRFGWGLTPAAWQGWLATGLFVVVFVATLSALRPIPPGARAGAALVELVVFVGLAISTSTWARR